MSNFSENELNAWRLTKRESRLFAPDSLKFHSFVVGAGSESRCGKKGSPHAMKIRQPAGRATVAGTRRLTNCGCHVENVDIASAVRLCSGSDACIPDCGCHFGESSDGTVGSATFVPHKDRQMQQPCSAMKRRASCDPRPRKVVKVSVQQASVTQKPNSVDTSGMSRLLPSVIKDCGVAIPSDSPSKPKHKRGKGKPHVEQAPLFRKLSVHLQRLPAKVVECYLSRPTVLLSKLPERLRQCQKVSSSQETPVTSPRSPGKCFKPDIKPEQLESNSTGVNDLSTQHHDKKTVDADIRKKSAQEEACATPACESRLRSKSEPRPQDLERRKKSNSDLRTVDEVKSSSTNSVTTDVSRKSPQKGAPVTSASDSRTRSKSEPQSENLEKRKKSSGNLSTDNEFKSKSTNSISVADATRSPQKEAAVTSASESQTHSKSELRQDDLEERKRSSSGLRTEDKVKSRDSKASAQKVTRQAVANQNALSPVSSLRSKSSEKVERLHVTRKRSRNSGEVSSEAAKDVGSKSTNAGTSKAEQQVKRKRTSAAEVIVNGTQEKVKSDVASSAADRLEEQVSYHSPTRHSTSSASALANSSQPKSPLKPRGLCTREMNCSALLKVDRLPELTNNNRSTVTANESVQETHSSASPDKSQTDLETTPKDKSLKRKRGRPRRDETASGCALERPEDKNEDGDQNLALETHSASSPDKSQTDLETTPKDKSLKRKRGRPRRDETDCGCSLERPKDGNEDGDQNVALEVQSQAPSVMSHTNSETKFGEKTMQRRGERIGSHQVASNESIEHRAKEDSEHVVTAEDENSASKAPVTSPNASGKRLKPDPKPEQLERRSTRASDLNRQHCRVSRNRDAVDADIKKESALEEPSATAVPESRQRSKSDTRPEDLERRKKSIRDLTTVEKSKSSSTNSLSADINRKPPQKEVSVTSPGESRTRSKSEPRPEGLEKKKSSSIGVKTEDKVKSPSTNSVNADYRAPTQKMHSRPSRESSKSASVPEDLGRRQSRSRDQKDATAAATVVNRAEDSVVSKVSAGDKKHAQEQAPVTSASVPGKHLKPDPKLDLERKKAKRSDLSSSDREKSRNMEAVNAGSSVKSAQEETPVTSANKSRLRSKSEPRPEDVEWRKKSSSDKGKNSSKNSVSTDGSRKSPQKEAPMTSETESQRRSKSESKLEDVEKRKRSGSGPMAEDKVKSPTKNSVNGADASKSPQKEAPVTSATEPHRRSKSEPKLEDVGKITRSCSGPRTEDKVKSPTKNSVSAADTSKSPQKETLVTPTRESRRRSKSVTGPEGLEQRKSSDMRAEDKVKSPSTNSVSADDNRNSAQKETPTRESSRRRSKSVPGPEGLEKNESSSSDQRPVENVNSHNKNVASAPDVNRKSAQKETAVASGSVSRLRSKSEPKPETLEKKNRQISDSGTQVKSPSRDVVNGDVARKSAQKMPPDCMKKTKTQCSNATSKTEDWEKQKLKRNDCNTETKSPNGKLDHRSETVVTPSDKKTAGMIRPKAHIDLSVHTEKIEHRHPQKVSNLFSKIPSKLERLKAKRYQNSNSNKPRDVFPASPYRGDSHVITAQKMLESLAPSPSGRSMRSKLSASRSSLNSLSSDGTEIESPAYEPLGSSPICMQNLRDDPEEIQKTKVISPSCRSDCCTLRQPQGSTSSPPKMQMLNKAAIRRLSDVFDALPPVPKGGTANQQTAEEQRQKCVGAVEEDGNEIPCHEADSSYFEEWSKSVREADQVSKAGFVAKYSKKSLCHEEMFSGVSSSSDRGKQLISPQKLSSISPVNRKLSNIAVNKPVLLGWEPLQSPSNCDPSCNADDAVTLNVNDSEASNSEEDCIITDIRPRSSLSSVIPKTPPKHIREYSGISTKAMERRNLGKSLTDIRPEQQIDESNSSTVNCASISRKWQNCNKSQFQSPCRCRPKGILRRCRSASPRLCHVGDCSIPEYVVDDDDDESSVPCDDTTISRLQQINERIKLLENSIPPVNPLWRRERKIKAAGLEDGGSKVETGGAKEDSGDDADDDESVIVLDEPDRWFSPVSPSCPPPNLEVERSSPVQAGPLTVENVTKHNRFLEDSCPGPSSSIPSSVCGMSDADDSDSCRSVTVTPRRVSDWESSFAGASTAGMNGVSDYSSPTTPCRSKNSSKNEGISNIDLPTCSDTKTQTLTVRKNGGEMMYLFSSPSSCVSDDVSPIFNRRRNSLHKGDENSVKCNRRPHSVSALPEVPVQDHISQPATSVRTDSISYDSSGDVQEIEVFLSPENGINSTDEGELARRNVKTPTEMPSRKKLMSPPPARLRTPPYSTDEQSSESSIERRRSVSSLEKSMLLDLYEQFRRMPPSEDVIMREEEEAEAESAGNDSICVDGSHSSNESEDLDAERKDTDEEVVAEGFGLQITRGDLATLSGTSWLNDKIVNFYLKLLTERGRQNREPEVYAYDTFFFPKLIKCGFESVKKWTRVVDVFKHDILIIPVHLGTHWCMTAVDFRKQTVVYYDSMGGQNESCLKTIWNYLHQECAERAVEPLSEEVWQLRCAKDIPKQSNNSDCGVFMCKYAECITRDADLEFSQSDMPAIRMDMMQEIQTMSLLHH